MAAKKKKKATRKSAPKRKAAGRSPKKKAAPKKKASKKKKPTAKSPKRRAAKVMPVSSCIHEAQLFAKDPKKAYCVVEAKNVGDLVREVQVRMNDGWEPEGGILSSGGSFMQAMAVD